MKHSQYIKSVDSQRRQILLTGLLVFFLAFILYAMGIYHYHLFGVPLFLGVYLAVGIALIIGAVIASLHYRSFYFRMRARHREILELLPIDEAKILGLLMEEGRTTQAELRKLTGLSKVKISRILKKLSGRGVVEKRGYGNTNLLVLKHGYRRIKYTRQFSRGLMGLGVLAITGIVGVFYYLGNAGVPISLGEKEAPPYTEVINWWGGYPGTFSFQKDLAGEYFRAEPVLVVPRGGRMNAAERLLSKGDIALYCRPTLSDSPLEREYRLFLIAWSGTAFVVNKQNPLEGLTIEQLREIYLGRISTWGEVGGGKGKIRLLERPVSLRDSPTITGVDYVARVLLFNNLNVPSQAETLPSTDDIIREMDRSPNAIAAVPLVDARDSDVKILRINSFYPTKENIMSGKYPFPRPLYLASYGEPSGALRGFIKFVLSKEGQEILFKSGLINLEEGENLGKSLPEFTGDVRLDI